MKESIREFARKDEGAIYVLFLATLILFVGILVYGVETNSKITASDVVTQQAIDQAARAAAMSVNEKSQAEGEPMVDPEMAIERFKTEFARNLRLDEDTMEPLSGSRLAEEPMFQLVIVNGDNPYTESGYAYTYDGGMDEETLTFSDLPVSLYLTDDGISLSSGEVESVFTRPGCAVFVKAKAKNLFNDKTTEVTRWAAARIVVNE